MNYENTFFYKDKISIITFGYFASSHIQGGEEGLNWYPNLGTDSWMVMLDDLMFNGQDLQTRPGAKKAHIDSAGMYI